MSGKPDGDTEVRRLESLWAGDFGDEYTERNKDAARERGTFWDKILSAYPVESVLEIGCNKGPNLFWISQRIPPHRVYGVDINEKALRTVQQELPGVNAIWSQARELPFRGSFFDLVFTAGVLIHQPDETLGAVMSEVVRCSKRYVLCLEYFAPKDVEVPYRGQPGALFKRDYGRIYRDRFPELQLLRRADLKRDEGWDDVTFWLFQKKGA